MPLTLINERPEGMSFEAYKELRKMQNKAVKKYSKGRIVIPKFYKKKK